MKKPFLNVFSYLFYWFIQEIYTNLLHILAKSPNKKAN